MIRSLVLFTSLALSAFTAANELVVSYVNHPHIKEYVSLVEKTYDDIDISIRLVEMPVGRRMMALNKGVIDADVSSQERASADFPNIIQVQPPLTDVVIYLACQRGVPCHEKVIHDESQELYLDSGMLGLLKGTLDYTPHPQVVVMDRIDAMLDLLELGRIEYLVWSADRHQELPVAIRLNLNVIELGNARVFHHIHKRHRGLLDKLQPALEQNLQRLRASENAHTTARRP